jgi:hypothetical protein
LQTVAALLKDSRRVRFGFLAVLIPAAGCTLMYFCGWIAGGSPSSFMPWLAIPIEQYFKYDIFIVALCMFMCWVLAAGAIQPLTETVRPREPSKIRHQPLASVSAYAHGQAWSKT